MSDNSLLIRINGDSKQFLDEIDKIKKQTQDLEKILETSTKTMAISFAAFAGSIALATKAYADYETALIGVGKTTDIEGKKLDAFGKKFKQMSSEIPIATNDLLSIAQAAGQLGVKGEENLLKFTDTVAKLGVATDLSGEEAALALTRVLNVTGESISGIDKLGSVIVELGNNFAASESEIVRMTTEIARATAVFGVNSREAVAMGTALRSMGVQAEIGGSAVGRSMMAIDKAIRSGGTSIQNLSNLTGIAVDQLKEQFETNAAGVFERFVLGLNKVQEAGGNVSATLQTFGLRGQGINKVIPVLAANANLLGTAFETANREFKENNALNKEAEKAFSTLNSDMQRTKNNITDIAANLGEQLAPMVRSLLQSLNGLLAEIKNVDEETLKSIASFLKWGAIITAAGTAAGSFMLIGLKLKQLMSALTLAFNIGRIAAIKFTSALTFGLSAVIAFLPEIIDGVRSMTKAFNQSKPRTLEQVNAELERINKQITEIQEKGASASSNELFSMKKLQEQRRELQKMREEMARATEDFGTGEMLVNPVAKQANMNDFNLSAFGISEGAVPFAPDEESVNQTKAVSDEIYESLDAETQKRIALAKKENEILKQLQADKGLMLTETDLALAEKRANLQRDFAKAEQIENEVERNLALENLRLANAETLKEIELFEATKDEKYLERREQRKALEDELREIDAEALALMTEEEITALQNKLETENDLKKRYATEEMQRRMENLKRWQDDEKKYGKTIADLNKFFNDEKVQGFKETSGSLAALAQSENNTMKSIGKAAASTNAAMATAEGAIKAYTAMVGIPVVGPALGTAAAAALIAFGVEQQAKILSANTWGVVPFMPGARAGVDSVPATLTPGELVVPEKNFDEVVNSVASQRAGGYSGMASPGGITVNISEMYGDEAFVNLMIDKIRDQVLYKDARLS